MSYLIFGTSTKKLATGDSSISKEAGLFIFNHVARDLAYEIGLDRLFIKYDSVVDEYAIEAGKRFGRKNMVIIEGSKAGR